MVARLKWQVEGPATSESCSPHGGQEAESRGRRGEGDPGLVPRTVSKSHPLTEPGESHGSRCESHRTWVGPVPEALLIIACRVSLLGWLCSLPAAFFSRHSTFLASPASWHLQCTFGFSVTAFCTAWPTRPSSEI